MMMKTGKKVSMSCMFSWVFLVALTTFLPYGLGKHSERSDTHHEEPINWDVKFVSGKEAASVYEPSFKMFQKRNLKIQNLVGAGVVAKVTCEDPFAKFSNEELEHGDVWEFYVLDWFSRRHYWCTAELSNGREYQFRAYGEGAPRAHNKIVLLYSGAVINGRNVTM